MIGDFSGQVLKMAAMVALIAIVAVCFVGFSRANDYDVLGPTRYDVLHVAAASPVITPGVSVQTQTSISTVQQAPLPPQAAGDRWNPAPVDHTEWVALKARGNMAAGSSRSVTRTVTRSSAATGYAAASPARRVLGGLFRARSLGCASGACSY
jgi:flagellar biosynthesis/type III secretory pathway M-ring protein FliF/YscJ